MKPRNLLWLILPLAALVLDWASKVWILHHIGPGDSRVILPGFFNLTLGFNPGFIFGSMGGAAPWFRHTLSLVAGIASLGYFGWEFLRNGTGTLQRVGLGLILGGALGNGLDRIQHGAVVDFLDFVFWGWHYWTFNVADSFIFCGAAVLAIALFKGELRLGQAEA